VHKRLTCGRATLGEEYHDSGYVFTCLNGDPMAPDRLSDTYTWVLPEVARKAAEDVATLIIVAGCLVPGTTRPRQPEPRPTSAHTSTRATFPFLRELSAELPHRSVLYLTSWLAGLISVVPFTFRIQVKHQT
jgi:hypothetical protein